MCGGIRIRIRTAVDLTSAAATFSFFSSSDCVAVTDAALRPTLRPSALAAQTGGGRRRGGRGGSMIR